MNEKNKIWYTLGLDMKNKLFRKNRKKNSEEATIRFLMEIFNSPRVSDDELYEGANLCLENSKNLVSLAKIAQKEKFYSYAASLAILSMEELAKVGAIRSCFLGINPLDWWSMWQLFSGKNSHRHKLQLFNSNLDWTEENIDVMILNYNKHKGKAGSLKSVKERGLYVDFDKGKSRFIKPNIKEQESEKLIKSVSNQIELEEGIQKLGFTGWFTYREVSKEYLKYVGKIIHNKVGNSRENK